MVTSSQFNTEEEYLLSFSGGQDSTTCLLHLLESGVPAKNIYLVSFKYGQKHSVAEERARYAVLLALGFTPDWINEHLMTAVLEPMFNSGLTSGLYDVSEKHPGDESLPASFVPGRNLMFILRMAQMAYSSSIKNLVLGVNAVDYSGYPDCRQETMFAMEEAIQLGFNNYDFKIITPLINSSKADIVRMAMNHHRWKEALAASHTCYRGFVPGCGDCPACAVRAKGFADAGIPDPRFEH